MICSQCLLFINYLFFFLSACAGVTLTVPETISEAEPRIQVCVELSLPSESSSDVSVNATVQTNGGSALSELFIDKQINTACIIMTEGIIDSI